MTSVAATTYATQSIRSATQPLTVVAAVAANDLRTARARARKTNHDAIPPEGGEGVCVVGAPRGNAI